MPDWSELGEAYLERVYAGILGKICGVYLGRPVEGWSRERIVATFGEVDHYVHESVGVPLIVTDDDIGGTFTFVRALADHDFPEPLLSEQVGRTWLDRLVPGHSVLWWGGRGVSTEHTAYLNLEAGISAPASGSAARNGTVVAEQIGAQIFIDAWAMVCPGDPAGAAELAEAAARVSHDGEAVAAARLVAAIEALAFDSADIREIIEAGLGFVDSGSLVAALVHDLLRRRATTSDWRVARDSLDRDWGYHRYGGGCHVLPNLGVVLLALLWGDGDLTRTLMIAVTCGWDTDCNAGTAGCIVALAAGLDAFETATDWRGPVGDRLHLSSSDGGNAVTDAVRESRSVQAIARGRRGLAPARPADAPRYDFALPGSTQGFCCSPEWPGTVQGRSRHDGDLGGLTVHAHGPVAQAVTAVFIPPDFVASDTYTLLASPALYPGQLVRARVSAPADTDLQLVLVVYDEYDRTRSILGPAVGGTGSAVLLELSVPDLAGFPVAQVGVRASRSSGTAASPAWNAGFVLHELGWTGSPRATLARTTGGTRWRAAWLHALDHPAPEPFGDTVPEFSLTQNRGTGLVSTGCDDWDDVALRAVIRPHSVTEFGIAVAVAGLRRHVALLVRPDGTVRLVRRRHEETELARAAVAPIALDSPVELRLESRGGRLHAWVDGEPVADVEAGGSTAGAVALLVTEGTVTVDDVTVASTSGQPTWVNAPARAARPARGRPRR